MASYESDSSDEDDRSYTETGVLLGYASTEPTSDPISHLGGHPSWLDAASPPSGELAKCKVCESLMTLLLQLNGNLPERFPGHERRLYLFTCRRKACRRKEGSVRGFRGVRIAKAEDITPSGKKAPEQKTQPVSSFARANIGETLFGVTSNPTLSSSANPFSSPNTPKTDSSKTTSCPPMQTSELAAKPPQKPTNTEPTLSETFASKARITDSPPPQSLKSIEPWPSESLFPPPYPFYHLDAEHEALDKPSKSPIPSRAAMDLDDGDANAGSGATSDKEVFESSMDKTFQRFADQLSQNPEQVLRYEYGGMPLLYSKTEAVGNRFAHRHQSGTKENVNLPRRDGTGIPRCNNCGAGRVFEVQLTPHAITELEANETGLDGMEWGTIIMGVCSVDCAPYQLAKGDAGHLEEWVGVQWEEMSKQA